MQGIKDINVIFKIFVYAESFLNEHIYTNFFLFLNTWMLQIIHFSIKVIVLIIHVHFFSSDFHSHANTICNKTFCNKLNKFKINTFFILITINEKWRLSDLNISIHTVIRMSQNTFDIHRAIYDCSRLETT